MILEAFARYLHNSCQETDATQVLGRWLWERLTLPPETLEDKILRSELNVDIEDMDDLSGPYTAYNNAHYIFSAHSDSGKRLLKVLYEYASGYEQQKWSRFVHGVKASDFNKL
jgi:hypothetical protein